MNEPILMPVATSCPCGKVMKQSTGPRSRSHEAEDRLEALF